MAGVLNPAVLSKPETPVLAHVPVDLTTCDREPIHHIGAIQPFGFLVAVTADLVISRVSANAAEHLGRPTAELLGASLRDVIERDAIHLTHPIQRDDACRWFEARTQSGIAPWLVAISLGDDGRWS